MHDASKSDPRPVERTPLWRRFVGPLLVLSFAAVVYNFTFSSSRVSGTVNVAGQPLNSGTITFHPLKAFDPLKSGSVAIGEIGDQGRYEAFTEGEPGLASGEYLITISPPPDAASEDADASSGLTPVPPRYIEKSTTPLRATIRAGSNQLDFDLTR